MHSYTYGVMRLHRLQGTQPFEVHWVFNSVAGQRTKVRLMHAVMPAVMPQLLQMHVCYITPSPSKPWQNVTLCVCVQCTKTVMSSPDLKP
jgi:hypothetical protein